jgi:hypothetical protein
MAVSISATSVFPWAGDSNLGVLETLVQTLFFSVTKSTLFPGGGSRVSGVSDAKKAPSSPFGWLILVHPKLSLPL